jgi:hypothetical protein
MEPNYIFWSACDVLRRMLFLHTMLALLNSRKSDNQFIRANELGKAYLCSMSKEGLKILAGIFACLPL